MALIYRGTTIPTSAKNIKYNGTALEKVIYNGVTVWQYVVPEKNIDDASLWVDSLISTELSAANGSAQHTGGQILGNSVRCTVKNCSYGTVTFIGYLGAIDLNGYTKMKIYVNEIPDSGSWHNMDNMGQCTFNISNTSYGVTAGSSHPQQRVWDIGPFPNNLGSKKIYFSMNVWCNTDVKTTRTFTATFKRIRLYN